MSRVEAQDGFWRQDTPQRGRNRKPFGDSLRIDEGVGAMQRGNTPPIRAPNMAPHFRPTLAAGMRRDLGVPSRTRCTEIAQPGLDVAAKESSRPAGYDLLMSSTGTTTMRLGGTRRCGHGFTTPRSPGRTSSEHVAPQKRGYRT